MPEVLPSPVAERRFVPILLGVLAAAAAVRWGRMPIAWDYWAIDYVSYPYGFRDDLTNGIFPWTRLVGLHPGQHGLACALLMRAGASVQTLFVLSVALSTGAIALGSLWLRRAAGPVSALAFAAVASVSPYLVHYGPELNNYPLFAFGTMATLAALELPDSPAPTRRVAALVAVWLAASLALHGHLAAWPLVGILGVLALIRRRWLAATALAAAALTAAPVLRAVLAMREQQTTFHNAPLQLGEVLDQLAPALARFGSPLALVCIGGAIALGTIVALRDPTTARPARTAALLLAANVVTTGWGMTQGAASAEQTPYWIVASTLLAALVALGLSASGDRTRVVLVALLVVWGLPSAHRALLPSAFAEPVGVGDPDAIAAHLEVAFDDGDVLVWLWDVQYLNDDPDHRTPLFAALDPGEIGDWLPRDRPFPGYGHRFRGGEIYFLGSVGLRDDEHAAALRDALGGWLEAGRRVHLVVAGIDPDRGGGSDIDLRTLAAERGAAWRDGWADRTRVIRIDPSRLSDRPR